MRTRLSEAVGCYFRHLVNWGLSVSDVSRNFHERAQAPCNNGTRSDMSFPPVRPIS